MEGLPFVDMSGKKLLGFDSYRKLKCDAHGLNYKAFIVPFFLKKENDKCDALTYINELLIQRGTF